jgi:O-antigen/teichoic acid export membrane protein
MTPIITREFSKYFEKKDFKNLRKLFSRYIPMLYSLAAYFGVFVSMQSDIVLAIFTDEKFADVYLVLVVMGFYPIHQTYGQLSGSIFYVTGQTKLIRNIAFISQPIGLILSFVFVYLLDFGAVGLAIKMIIWQVMVVNIQLYFNAKFLNLKIMRFILHQIYAIIFFVVLAYLSTSIISFESPLVYFLASGFLYTIFVAIFTYIFPKVFSTTREEIDEVYIKVRKKILLKIKDTNG